jgi:ParB family chromosome partitioning protein
MGKLDELRRTGTEAARESMGAGAQAPPVNRAPAPTATSKKHDRLKRITTTAAIPLESIARDPRQPREDFDPDEIKKLADSLGENGQLQPIRVRWDEEQGVYVIICGERRWRAATMAGHATIDAVIETRDLSPAEIAVHQLIENGQRKDLKPIEQAKAFKTIKDETGWPIREIARRLSVDHSVVVRALALLNLDPETQQSVEQGHIPPNTAYQLTKVEDLEERHQLAAQAAAGQLRRDDLAEHVRQPRERQARAGGDSTRPRNWTHATDRGRVTLTAKAEDVSDEELTELLAEALKQRRKASRKHAA